MSFTRNFLTLLLFYFGSVSSNECPSKEDIYPCFCENNNKALTVRCNGLTSLGELQSAISGVRGLSFNHFTIGESSIKYIPSDAFENVTIKYLDIIKTPLTIISVLGLPQFKGLEDSLKILSIVDSFTRERPLAYLNLGHMKKLEALDFKKNVMELVHNAWFKGGPFSLTTINFVQAEISRVGYRAFVDLVNLRSVDLSENTITYLSRSMFPKPASKLTGLNLSRNKISSLSEDFFIEMPSLRRVDLELNEFISISENTWSPVWSHLDELNIDYNPLVCDSQIKWIYSYGEMLEGKIIASCYKPFKLMDRTLDSLNPEELE